MSANPAAQAMFSRLAPFDHLAETYDATFTDSPIGRAQRGAVWRELDRCFLTGQRVLELNCGTGVDAVHLAGRGIQVLACDAAPRMIEVAGRRLREQAPGLPVKLRVLPTEQIAELRDLAPFDGAFSNFGGLNCVEDLTAVAAELAALLRPGATALLCLLGRTAAWEIAWYLSQGRPRKALRRFERGGAAGRLAEGVTVKVYYPSIRAVKRAFRPHFRLTRLKGIGVAVPPSYASAMARRFPRLLEAMVRLDARVSALPLFRSAADHVLFEFQRTVPRA